MSSKSKSVDEVARKIQADSFIQRGDAYFKKGRYHDALRAYEEAIRCDPGSADAHARKGNSLYKLGMFHKALLTYEVAIQLDPQCAAAYNGKGQIFKFQKRWGDALLEFEKAIRRATDTNSIAEYYHNETIYTSV